MRSLLNDKIVDMAIDAEDNKTRNLVIKTLKEIGCQPEVNDEDDICFKYQGKDFFIDADNRVPFITLWNIFGVPLTIDVNIMKEAINQTNLEGRITLSYSINKKRNIMVIYCKSHLPFIYGIPAIQEYLQCNLDNYSWTYQYLMDKHNSLKENPTMQSSKEQIIIETFNTKRDNE